MGVVGVVDFVGFVVGVAVVFYVGGFIFVDFFVGVAVIVVIVADAAVVGRACFCWLPVL